MNRITFLILLQLLIFSSCSKKNPEKYNDLITEARNLYKAGEYENSGEKFSEAFEAVIDSDTLSHRYEAARAWALAQQKDSAFTQLFEISNEGKFADLKQISSDRALNSLSTDERWMKILNIVSQNKQEAQAYFSEVATILDTVYREDQYYRQQIAGIQEEYGRNSEEVRAKIQ